MVLIWACWLWLAGALLAALLAVYGAGADVRGVAAALALTASPAFAGFLLFPFLGKPTADAGWIAAWTLMAMGLSAGADGAVSPFAAAFMIGPAVAAFIRPAWVQPAGGAAVAGYAVAAWLARYEAGADLRSYAAIMAAISITFATALFSLALQRRSASGAANRRVAEVSHELRTPLNHILGFSEMIERQMFGEIGARYVEYAGLIRRSGAHLLTLVNDLLDLSKIDAGRYTLELEALDAGEVAAEVVRLATDSAERKSIVLGLSTPLAPIVVRADASALRRMLINTVGNAIKFTPEGGRVMLTVSAAEGCLQFDTDDSGPGIPEADRARLGRSYERGAGATAEGTGLGLALTRALAELHGGTLSFHASAEGGALVRIRLPVLAG